MSAWSLKRKIYIYLTGISCAVFMVAVGFFFTLYTPPSCNDGIQNGSEAGVDCGSVCGVMCAVQPVPLLPLWTRTFPVSEGVYAAVAYVENQNETLYVPEVQYEIVLYDATGSVVERSSQKTLIMENSITPIFVPYILTGKSKPVTASFRFTEEPIMYPRERSHALAVQDVRVAAPDGTPPQVRALVTNFGKDLPEVDFIVVVYDEDGIAIAASRTFEKYFLSDETRELYFTWVYPFTLRTGPCPGGQCPRQVERAEVIPLVLE